MLTLQEQQDVETALANALAQTDVRVFIQTTFGVRHREMLLQLPNTLARPLDQAAFIVSYCLDARWPPPPTPSLLEGLLTALVTGGLGALAALRNRVQLGQAADPNPDPVRTLWVRDTLPFFSREDLRPVLKRLLESDAQPILRIIGPGASGKTYTQMLIDHVCSETRRDVHVVAVEVPKNTGPTYTVEDLADTLVTPTTRDVASRPVRSTSNYPAALCRWVLNAARQTPGRWIYILDGFDQQHIPEETRELVQALAAQISGPGEYRKRMRLVLVDYRTRLPSVLPGMVLEETVPDPATLKADDLAACLAAHYQDLADRGRPKGDLAPDAVRTTAVALFAEASQEPETMLAVLNESLTRLRRADLGV